MLANGDLEAATWAVVGRQLPSTLQLQMAQQRPSERVWDGLAGMVLPMFNTMLMFVFW